MRRQSMLLAMSVIVTVSFLSTVSRTGAHPSLQHILATATLLTSTNLQEADNALFNGDYDKARALYVAATYDPKSRCEALQNLGLTDLRAKAFETAEAILTRALGECTPTFGGYLLRATTRHFLNKDDQALDDYKAALNLQPGVIDSYIDERMASIAGDDSLRYLRLAAEMPRAPAGQLALRRRLLEVYKALNNTPGIVEQYQAMLALSDDKEELAGTEVALADIELANNQAAKAYARLQRVLAQYPDTKPAFSALITLVAADQPVSLVVRTRINVRNENYQPVIARVSNYLASVSVTEAPAELYVLLGKAQRGLGNFDGALATFQKARDLYPKDPMASVAALEQAETYILKKDRAKALAAYLATAATYPTSPEAAEALWRAANYVQSLGDSEQATALYEQLATAYPRSEHAVRGLFKAGTLLVVTNPHRAASFFGRMNNAQGLLWQGKLLQQLNEPVAAQKAWSAATAKEPDTFFGLRAQDLLTGTAPYQPATDIRLRDATEAERAVAEQWMRDQFHLSSVSPDLPAELAHDPGLIRGTELWALGWWLDAQTEFDALHKRVRDNPLALYQLAHYYRKLRIYRSSILAATRLMNLSKISFTKVPPYIARLAYPIYYNDLLIPAAQAYSLDPLYVAALIRTESVFDSSAFSSAEARGLMQLIASTADDIADQLKWSDFQADDLFRPLVSIRFGTAYLHRLKQLLNNNSALALIGYNAGPGYAYGLLESADDLDRLYQSIDIEETRQYIVYTYETYTMYRLLYGIEPF